MPKTVSLLISASTEIQIEIQSIARAQGHELRDVASSLLMLGIAMHKKDGVLREQGRGNLYVAPNYNPHREKFEHRTTVKLPIKIHIETKKYIDATAGTEEMRFGQVAFWLLIRGLESYKRDIRPSVRISKR